ncbi:response regulator transcription factor [Actinomadura sp. 9N407]|uniref:response regulator transcription factor n=1 Tax=Actinomadura sp. 9N407 TaxID=3375154 RepID=UPI00378F0880
MQHKWPCERSECQTGFQVLDLIATGLADRQIAERLVLSPKTVRNNVSNIFGKLQVADRSQAILRAREAGLGN